MRRDQIDPVSSQLFQGQAAKRKHTGGKCGIGSRNRDHLSLARDAHVIRTDHKPVSYCPRWSKMAKQFKIVRIKTTGTFCVPLISDLECLHRILVQVLPVSLNRL